MLNVRQSIVSFMASIIADENGGWMVSSKGGVYEYNGENWQQVKKYSNTSLQSISAISDKEAWIAGYSVIEKGNNVEMGGQHYVYHILL